MAVADLHGLSPDAWSELSGKSFVVTGAGSGFGQCIACVLAQAGCVVYLVGRRRSKLEETAQMAVQRGANATSLYIVEADLTDVTQLRQVVQQIVDSSLELHGLINNAAVIGSPIVSPLLHASQSDWDMVMDTNLQAPWMLSKELIPKMVATGFVRILNIISGAAWGGTPGLGLYNVSKAALSSLTYSMAMELAEIYPAVEVQVNALDPGEARTEMNQGSEKTPFTVVPMTLKLLSAAPAGPNGKFFHADGRHLAWGESTAYQGSLSRKPSQAATVMQRFEELYKNKVSALQRLCPQNNKPPYPFSVQPPNFSDGLDMILLELPARYAPMMPNGLGYVHNILKTTGIKFQTYDFNIYLFHKFHRERYENGCPGVLASGQALPDDPWENTHTELWEQDSFLDYFKSDFQALALKLIQARPAIIGFSLNALNLEVVKVIATLVREALPKTQIVVGGYSCVYPKVGPTLFLNYDYMVIGEAECVLPDLITALLKGERPKDLPGVISCYDSPDREWIPATLPTDLDSNGFPTYEWADINLYRRYDGSILVPLSASRGCCWSRCNFCCECFQYRHRDYKAVIDEIEWFVARGINSFYFNESDVNGNFTTICAICTEIIRRNLKVFLGGQLRIDKRSDIHFFRLLRYAGFGSLRFGVDGWSDHTLRLQKKGYTMDIVNQNLIDCSLAGIHVSVNIVIGVPGETEQDIDESIQNMLHNKDRINIVENIHTLILGHGSDYYNNPDKHKIKFIGNKDELYDKYINFIPCEYWYSDDPYIDQSVRVSRMTRLYNAIVKAGIDVGGYANRVVERTKNDLHV